MRPHSVPASGRIARMVRKRQVVGFAGNLVDLVDVDDAALRALDVVVGRLQQFEDDVLSQNEQ
jgi:hypothetical protein